ncbi:transmembrane protein 209-like [Halichondria panicea]|uniref:transmembrane protein 209-like n=1 Tax=Halichondria panicea TaxID=6063 RepID=UPI00312B6A95
MIDDRSIMATKRKLGPVRSPVVSFTLAKKKKQILAGKAMKNVLGILLTVIVVSVDWYFLVLARLFFTEVYHFIFSTFELLVLSLLLFHLLYSGVLVVTALLTKDTVRLTSIQKKLLGIKEKAYGYISISYPAPFGPQLSSEPVSSQHANSNPPLHFLTPTNSPHSPHRATSGSVSASRTPTPSSWYSHSFAKGSPCDNDKMKISDCTTLETFLKCEQDREHKVLSSSPNVTGSPLSCDQYGSDFAPTPRKYHLSTRSLPSCLTEGDSLLSSDSRIALSKLGISRDELSFWNDRCRKWLAERVVCPVAREIEKVNAVLKKMGNTDLMIGSVSLPKLQQIAKIKAQQVPTLSVLAPYLELSTKQDYLVSRTQELSKGTNLSAFHWDSGGSWRGKQWNQSLPSDSQIVMHLFCTYMDSQFPPNPQYPADGKAFSSRHFMKAPDKTSGLKKVDVCIYQESLNPPDYQILLKEKRIELSKGRNNMLNAIAVFLYCVKTHFKSTLGSVHLDKTGLNALWITERE